MRFIKILSTAILIWGFSFAFSKPSAESWTLGEQKFLVILVNHAFKSWDSTDAVNFERMLNEQGYSDNGSFGSVRDYFLRQSGGKFQPTFKVFGPYTYSDSSGPKNNEVKVMKTVLYEASKNGDVRSFNGYAKNSEGTFVGLVLAGAPSDYGMDGHIFARRMGTTHSQGKVGHFIYIPGKNEYDSTTIDGMGTFTHEFSHVLGLPDLYQTSTAAGIFNTPGNYDVMDVGAYNDMDLNFFGTHVPNMSAFEREWLGWLTPTTLSPDDGLYSIPSYDSSNFAYQIVDPTDSNQYFILENRQQKNWDASLPGHGLLIWHIDYDTTLWKSNGGNANTPNNVIQYVDIEEASLEFDDAYTYPGGENVTEFDRFVNLNGDTIFPKISNIVECNDSIFFTIGNAKPKVCSGSSIRNFVRKQGQRIFVGNRLSPFATASIQTGSRLEIYRLDGSLAQTFTDASEKNLSLSNGIFMAVLRSGSRTILKEMFTVR